MMDEFKPDWDGLPPEERALAEDAAQRLQPSLEEWIRDALTERLRGFTGAPLRHQTFKAMAAATREQLDQFRYQGSIEEFEITTNTAKKCVEVFVRLTAFRVFTFKITCDP